MIYGFSTGALGKGDFKSALAMLEIHAHEAVEISALRLDELPALLKALPTLALSRYSHVTLHAPSRFPSDAEHAIADHLASVADQVTGIVVHAEVIVDPAPWRALGRKVLVENADGRKATGRTLEEFQRVVDTLPDARICFDIAHAHQVDPTLLEARRLIRAFHSRIGQIHLSQLDHACHHQRLSFGIVREFQRLASLLPDTAAILESCVAAADIARQIELAQECFRQPGGIRPSLFNQGSIVSA
jgi:hypothetical protein